MPQIHVSVLMSRAADAQTKRVRSQFKTDAEFAQALKAAGWRLLRSADE